MTVDLVTRDLAEFCRPPLGRNGYALEQLPSPLVAASSGVRPAYLAGPIAAERAAEHGAPPADDPSREAPARDAARPTAALEEARDRSALPEAATAHRALHDPVVRTRPATAPAEPGR